MINQLVIILHLTLLKKKAVLAVISRKQVVHWSLSPLSDSLNYSLSAELSAIRKSTRQQNKILVKHLWKAFGTGRLLLLRGYYF